MRKKYLTFLLIGTGIIIIDQITKWLVLENFAFYESLEVIPGFFNLTYIRNTGVAFGLFAGKVTPLRTGIFLSVSIVALVMIFFLYANSPAGKPWFDRGLAMTFGGVLGNIVDRLRLGEVIDFLDFHIGTLHWPAFNVADSAITVGVGIFCYHLLLKKV